MFRKIFVTVITFIYLAVGTGFTVNAHYCFGLLHGVSLTSENSCSCGHNPAPCCKTKSIHINLGDKHQAQHAFLPLPHHSFLAIFTQHPVFVNYKGLKCLLTVCYKAPPNQHKQPVYILNNTFRI